MDLYKYIGGFMRDTRLKMDVKQAVIANALNLSVQQISKYENGHSAITCSKLIQFLLFTYQYADLTKLFILPNTCSQKDNEEMTEWEDESIDELGNRSSNESSDESFDESSEALEERCVDEESDSMFEIYKYIIDVLSQDQKKELITRLKNYLSILKQADHD